MFIANRPINPDKDFFGFKLRTRARYQDDKIIRQILSGNDPYRIPENPKVVIDVGANIGCFSLLAASKGAVVYAFEPEQLNYETLCHNVEINGFGDKIHCDNHGVGIPGKTKLYVHSKNSGATSSYLEQRGLEADRYQEVDFISIHDVFNCYNIKHCSLLKMDCEGSERDIIRDMDDGLASRIDQISLEFHNKGLIKELVDKLSRWYVAENTRRYEFIFCKK